MRETPIVQGVDISAVGALLADPARASILLALSGGVALPASDLAQRAGITPSTASTHLARLLEVEWVAVERHGRHRYYRLASPQVAAVLEHLACVAPAVPVRSLRGQQQNDALRLARSCYDHLAGKLGVALADALVQQDVLRVEGSDFVLTPQGTAFLRQHGVDVPEATRRRRAFARRCLDWSERRDHLAGALGAALFATWTAQGWITCQADSRALRLTPLGVAQLPAWGVAWPLDATHSGDRRQALEDGSCPG
jgi:DNA-binding transcriptional ArsR family regulator